MTVTHLDPDSLFTSPAFSQGTLAEGTRIVHVGGQNGVDGDGKVVEGFAAQSAQAMRNVLAVLKEAGADQTNVVKLGIHLVAGQDPREGFGATAEVWGQHKTAVTVLLVSDLGPEGALVEIDAVAVL